MDDDVVFFAMVQRYNIYFKYVSLHHDILGSHGAKSSTENIYWAPILRNMAKKIVIIKVQPRQSGLHHCGTVA